MCQRCNGLAFGIGLNVLSCNRTSRIDTLAMKPPTTSPTNTLRSWQSIALCLLIPFALVGLVLFVSPNFSLDFDQSAFHEPVRSGSFGGDFLQEYVGGHIWNHQRDGLYDWEYSKSIQHQPDIVGFAWKQESFFPMVYPPFHYQLASIFSGWSYPKFAIAFSLLNAIALFIAAVAFVFGYRELNREKLGWLFAALLFVPLLLSLNMGQKSAILLAILTVSFVLLHREKPLAAGLVFGLIAFKPHFAILIGLTMLFKKQWWFVAGSFVTLAILIGISLVSPESWRGYLETSLGFNQFVNNGGYQLHESHSLWGATQLLVGDRMPWLVKPLAGALALVIIALVWHVMRGPLELSSTRFALQFSVLVVAMVLTSPHFYTYDLTILLLPLAICVVGRHREAEKLAWSGAAIFLGVVFSKSLVTATDFQLTLVLFTAWIIVIAVLCNRDVLKRQVAAPINR